jgi:hypothetical protein
MTANRISAGEGARWLLDGLRVLRKAPLQLMLLHLAFLFAVALLLALPAIGFAIFWLLTPALLIGPHAAVRAAAQGRAPGFPLIVEGFRGAFAALVRLGLVFVLALFVALGATALADDGQLFRAMLGIQKLRLEDLFKPELHQALLVWAVLETAVLSVLWYAPLLVAWQGVPAAKSVFFSTAAIVLNWRAMLAFGGAMLIALFAVSFLALLLASLVARTEQARILSAGFAATWTLLPILFAASWRSYEAIFGGPPPGGGTAAPARDTGSEAD